MAKLSSSVSRRTLSEFEMFAKNPPPFAFVATDDLVDTALLVRLLSTRLGSLFLPPDHLSAIVVGRSGVEEHAQYDHNPRYDARRLAQAWSQVRGCPLILCDTLPLPPEIVCDCRQISRVYGSKFRRQSP